MNEKLGGKKETSPIIIKTFKNTSLVMTIHQLIQQMRIHFAPPDWKTF